MSEKGSEEILANNEPVHRVLGQGAPRDGFWSEASNEVLWITDGNLKRLIYVSPAYETVWGRPLPDLHKNPDDWLNAVHSEDRTRVEHVFRNGPASGGFELEYRVVHPDGKIRSVCHRSFPIYDDEGRVDRIVGLATDVTARNLGDKRVRESEARLHLFIENLPDGAVYVDGNDESIRLNRAAEEITGFLRSELTTVDEWFESVYGDEQVSVRRTYERDKRAGFPAPRTVRITRKDGRPRDIEFTVYEDERGAIWLLRDVTEKKLGREALIQRTRELNERIKELRCLYGIAGLVETPGIRLAEIFQGIVDLIPTSLQYPQIGCARIVFGEQVSRTKLFEVTPWKIASDFVVKGEKAGVLEAYYTEQRPDSHEGPFQEEERNLIDAVAERLGRIIERKRAEERQHQLTTVVEQAAESIIIMDTEGRIEYVNPAFERLSGYTRKEVLGKHPRFLREVDEPLYELLWQTIRDGETWEGRLVSRKKDGTRYEEEGTVSPVRDEKGEIVRFVTVMRDVTELVKLEDSLRQAQKMEAVGQLAGGVAHDFNNLLTVILTNCHYLLRGTDESSPLRQDIEEIKQSGERAAALTRQLLAFSRRQVLEPRVVDLNQILDETEKMLRRLIGEHIEMETVRTLDLGRVFVDPAQVEQVILNLAVNARDAMPNGGKLTLKTDNVYLDEAYARLHDDLQPGGYVLLGVSDNGCGMDESTRSRIFEPFFTTKEQGKGTGLGLASVYGIVKQGGGHIWVYSEVDKGTVFKIYFPAVDLEQRTERETDRTMDSWQGSETILVVEDDELVRRTAVRILRDHNYVVLEASSGEQALEICGSRSTEIDLMLTDMVMPRIGGRELSRLVAEMHSTIRVIFMSGYTENGSEHLDAVDSDGAFVQKPLIPSELARKVRKVLDGRGG